MDLKPVSVQATERAEESCAAPGSAMGSLSRFASL